MNKIGRNLFINLCPLLVALLSTAQARPFGSLAHRSLLQRFYKYNNRKETAAPTGVFSHEALKV
jgi:hypothetical protein